MKKIKRKFFFSHQNPKILNPWRSNLKNIFFFGGNATFVCEGRNTIRIEYAKKRSGKLSETRKQKKWILTALSNPFLFLSSLLHNAMWNVLTRAHSFYIIQKTIVWNELMNTVNKSQRTRICSEWRERKGRGTWMIGFIFIILWQKSKSQNSSFPYASSLLDLLMLIYQNIQ